MKRLTFGLALGAALLTLPVHVSASTPVASIHGLKSPGTLTFGTNFGYPPMEMYTGFGTRIPTGADVDFATYIARKLRLKARFVNVTNFDTIIQGLQGHKYDVIISSLSITPERARQVNFVPYLNVGQSIVVQRGNPLGINTLSDLSGKKVAVQSNTTEYDSLVAENKVLAARHKPLISITTFPEDTQALRAVANGQYVADLEDYPVAVYTVQHTRHEFDIAGQQFAASPYGIAIRKGDTGLFAAVKDAYQQMRKDGTYRRILVRYGLTQAAL